MDFIILRSLGIVYLLMHTNALLLFHEHIIVHYCPMVGRVSCHEVATQLHGRKREAHGSC